MSNKNQSILRTVCLILKIVLKVQMYLYFVIEKRFCRLFPCERQKDLRWRGSAVRSRSDHWPAVQP